VAPVDKSERAPATRAAPRQEATPGNAGRLRLLVVALVLAATALGLRFGLAPSHAVARATTILGALAALSLPLVALSYVFDRWLFGGRRLKHAPELDPATGKWKFRNWATNQSFAPADTATPRSLAELVEVVQRHGRAGRKIKAVGSLHSWSACAVAEDVCIPMAQLDRVLAHDPQKRTITVEAGIQLRALYREMDERDLAIGSIPNVDTIQLGGAIANATHGTNLSRGTMSSFVVELQVVVFQADGSDPSRGKAELCTLRRDDPDPRRRAWFEAAVASFGSVGVIYAITLQCEEPYACMVVEHAFHYSHIEGRIAEIAKKYYSALINVSSSSGVCRSKIQCPVPRELVKISASCLLTDNDLRILKMFMWAASPTAKSWLWLRRWLNRRFYNASLGKAGSLSTQQRIRREGVMSWRDAELMSRVFAVAATAPWINLEYAVPLERADEAASRLLSLKKQYPVFSGFVMRPVGADTAGFLSPTKGRDTVFFDIGYHQDLLHTGIYAEIEKLLLDCDGRCSWSRLFKAPAEEIIKQYPEYAEFLRAKQEMDPCNVFANAFSDAILFPAGQAAPAASRSRAAG
jgi:FAD/FMN-containing dehydrogenase